MGDFIFLAGSVAFFVASVLYAFGCQSLKRGRDDA
jgi:hypothetical protein